jgi:hypothetical protein
MKHSQSKEVLYEPDAWFLVFEKETKNRCVDFFAKGKFKHVWAFGYVEALRVWIFYEVLFKRTVLIVRPDDDETRALIVKAREKSSTLTVAAKLSSRRLFRGFWCVPAMAHLVGSNSSALLPDRLWSDLMAEGATEL